MPMNPVAQAVLTAARSQLGYVEQGGPDGHSGNLTMLPKPCCRCGTTENMGKSGYCRPCGVKKTQEWKRNNPEKARAAEERARHKARDNGRSRATRLKYRYGLTPAQTELLFEAAQHRCQACGISDDLCVDHDHDSGAVRGVLCRACNFALGLLGDDPERIVGLVTYAKGHR